MARKFWDLKEFRTGGFFDLSTLFGVFKGIVFCLISFFLLWYSEVILYTISYLFLADPIVLQEHEIRSGKGIALVFCGAGVVLGVMYFIFLYFSIKRVRDSCKGQWHERISREDLHNDGD